MSRLMLCTVALATIVACATVPFTGRRQVVLVSPAEEAALGAEAFAEVLAGRQIVRGGGAAEAVHEVGHRLAEATRRADFAWEFALVRGDEVNAFALPGGKAAVFTGMLPVAETTTGLAVVLGHEIGHVIARHGAERMSQELGVGLVAAVLQAGVGGGPEGDLVMAAFGLGAQVGVLLPYGRRHELEADHIGLFVMAQAGYDPREALAFWDRMERSGDDGPPEFLSTHPSESTRRATLRMHLAQALDYYAGSRRAPVRVLKTASAARALPITVAGNRSGNS